MTSVFQCEAAGRRFEVDGDRIKLALHALPSGPVRFQQVYSWGFAYLTNSERALVRRLTDDLAGKAGPGFIKGDCGMALAEWMTGLRKEKLRGAAAQVAQSYDALVKEAIHAVVVA
jgi:hypothetical protein